MSSAKQTQTNSEDYLRMYRQMVRIRTFEDNANQLYLSAKMPGLTHMYSGEEAVAVGICEALKVSDKITSTHRGHGHCVAKGAAFKELCLQAALQVQDGRPGYGILCDNRIGRSALHKATGTGLWIGRPTERPGLRPIEFEPELGEDLGKFREWARENVVKLLVFVHPDDDVETQQEHITRVKRLFTAARRNGLEFLLEIIPSKVGPVDDETSAILIQSFYDAGVYPDWWKLEPFKTEAAWQNAVEAIERNDPRTRGIVVLGLDAPEAELAASFALAAKQPLVKGFAVGRTIFGDAARAWLKSEMADDAAVAQMAERYTRLCEIWDKARAAARLNVE